MRSGRTGETSGANVEEVTTELEIPRSVSFFERFFFALIVSLSTSMGFHCRLRLGPHMYLL